MNCDQQKYNCGQVLPSSCIPYTGSDLTCIASPSLLACNANMNDVIGLIDGVVKKLVDGDNLTGLNPLCLIFDPATVTPAALHQVEINKICGLDATLSALVTQFNELNVGTLPITIDMQCLTAAVSACVTPVNTYPLVAVLNAMLSEICALKTAAGI